MKIPLLHLITIGVMAVGTAFGESVSKLDEDGQRALAGKDVEMAKKKFEAALKIDPNDPTAKGYMRSILALEKKVGPASEMEVRVKSLVLPEVKFKDATFGQALEYLKQAAEKQDVAVSFVVQNEVDQSKPVTLNLNNIPFVEALRYVCNLAGVKFSVEKFAIVVKSA